MRSRRIIGILLLLVAVVSVGVLALLALATLRHPEPMEIEERQQAVQVGFSVARTRTPSL